MVGGPDEVAGHLIHLAERGIGGVAVSFVNYLDELPFFCDEVLPRLDAAGLRGRQHDDDALPVPNVDVLVGAAQ